MSIDSKEQDLNPKDSNEQDANQQNSNEQDANQQNSNEQDSKKSIKILEFIKNHHAKVSTVSYLLSFLVFGLLVSEFICERTYFSDNALLPGFVKRDFILNQPNQDYLKELEKLVKQSPRLPVDSLVSKFESFGLQVYTQEFESYLPFRPNQNKTGRNIYAILRSSRSLNTEALVLSSPFRVESNRNTLPGISLLVSLAEYFSTKNYWSKDLIFLIYEHDLIGCEAWLQSYFNLDSNYDVLIKSEELKDRSGVIQAAINLEFTTKHTPNLDIRIEGLNGQLPNLDLFNVVVEIASRESVDATFHKYSHIFSPDQFEIWQEYAKTIGSMIFTQASTFTNGAHGLFQKRSIQSLTLVAEEEQDDYDYLKADLNQLGRVIEGVFRSCNNMIERFNRSYWFYLLPSTRRYLSISFYMIPLGLLVFPLLLKALATYLNLLDNHRSTIETFWLILPKLLRMHLYGLVAAALPYVIMNTQILQASSDFDSGIVLNSMISLFTLTIVFSPSLKERKKDSKRKLKKISIQKYVALLELALIITCLSLINISLALVLSVICVPLMCTITGRKPSTRLEKFRNVFHKILLIVLNPFFLIEIVGFIRSLIHHGDQLSFDNLYKLYSLKSAGIVSSVEELFYFGNWTYLIAAILYPVYLQFCFLLR